MQAKHFWEEKILVWESSRYSQRSGSWLESLASKSSRSLRFRQNAALQLLGPMAGGKRVVELGCGSGLLAPALLRAGARSYHGYDIADSAVAAGRQRLAKLGWGDRAQFTAAPVHDLPPVSADIVFSLGLLDWLDDDEIQHLFQITKGAAFLHSFSEKRASPAQWLHRAYVFCAYGHRTQGYSPRYNSARTLEELSAAPNGLHVFRHPALSFGAFLCSFPPVARA